MAWLLAEHGREVRGGHGLQRPGVQQRRGLYLHVGPDVVPGLGHLALFQINLVGDLLDFAHGYAPFLWSCAGQSIQKTLPQ